MPLHVGGIQKWILITMNEQEKNNSAKAAEQGALDESMDLQGKLCPFAVMCVIKEVDGMEKGETREFIVDDPLAIKSVPEELSEYDDINIDIRKGDKAWSIIINKS